MTITLPYSDDVLSADGTWLTPLGTLDISDAPPLGDMAAATEAALATPIGMAPPLDEAVKPGERVVIVVSDSFRQTGIHEVLPTLLQKLGTCGVREEDIFFLFATGTHRPPTDAEKAIILGHRIYERFHARAISHDPDDTSQLVHVGTTSRGTRVELNRLALECDRLIVTGAVVLHYFGGFGGGRKSILPGVASRETIAQNHALNLHPTENRLNPDVRIGVLLGNPVAEDMAEGARFCKVDLLINTVRNQRGEIAALFAGDLETTHREAAEYARRQFVRPIEQRADLVIASAGKNKNFVQCHKALFNAWQAMQPRGRIILAAPAPEGLGGNRFQEWLSLGHPDRVIEQLRRAAEINGQTALSTLEKAPRTAFITEMTADEVSMMGGRKAGSLEEALAWAREELGAEGIARPTCYVMPSAAYTVPELRGE